MRETRAATVESRDGFVVVRIRPGVRQTLEDARANLDACATEWGSEHRDGLLLDITRAVPLDPEVRHFYTGPTVDKVCSALALVVESSPLGRIMGNVYLRVARLSVPTQVFPSEDKALAWLRRDRAKRLRA